MISWKVNIKRHSKSQFIGAQIHLDSLTSDNTRDISDRRWRIDTSSVHLHHPLHAQLLWATITSLTPNNDIITRLNLPFKPSLVWVGAPYSSVSLRKRKKNARETSILKKRKKEEEKNEASEQITCECLSWHLFGMKRLCGCRAAEPPRRWKGVFGDAIRRPVPASPLSPTAIR